MEMDHCLIRVRTHLALPGFASLQSEEGRVGPDRSVKLGSHRLEIFLCGEGFFIIQPDPGFNENRGCP